MEETQGKEYYKEGGKEIESSARNETIDQSDANCFFSGNGLLATRRTPAEPSLSLEGFLINSLIPLLFVDEGQIPKRLSFFLYGFRSPPRRSL